MDKIWATVAILGIVVVLLAIAILPQVDGLKETGTKAQAQTSSVNALLDNSNLTTANNVIQFMNTAKNQGTGFLVDGSSALVTASGNGAVSFSSTGAYQTGKIYVVVNYLPTASGTYTQATDPASLNGQAQYSMVKLMDANGKVNRYTFTQVDLGK